MEREPSLYIGTGKRRRPIYIEHVGVTVDGKEIFNPCEDINDPVKRRERADRFAYGLGLVRKKETAAV